MPRWRTRGDPRAVPRLIEASAPNESWPADVKAWFRTGDGGRCEPLTVTDGYSRYLLACEAVPQGTAERVRPILTGLFQEHGLPRALRTDNGSPLRAAGGGGDQTKSCDSYGRL